jgi:hypothetical protein
MIGLNPNIAKDKQVNLLYCRSSPRRRVSDSSTGARSYKTLDTCNVPRNVIFRLKISTVLDYVTNIYLVNEFVGKCNHKTRWR